MNTLDVDGMKIRIHQARIGEDTSLGDFNALGASKSCPVQDDTRTDFDSGLRSMGVRGHG
jgi:hypothetical protein